MSGPPYTAKGANQWHATTEVYGVSPARLIAPRPPSKAGFDRGSGIAARWIGFASAASNLVANDFNNDIDVFLACNPFDAFECAAPTPTPTVPMDFPCVGDCNGDGVVTINDLIKMVNIALALAPLCPTEGGPGCLAGDANCDCQITVDDIIRAVNNSLGTCTDFGACDPAEHAAQCCGGEE